MPDNTNNNNNNNNNDDEYEKYCYMCRRPESETGRLLGMADNIYICPDCLQKVFNSINNNSFQFLDFSKFPGFGDMNAFTHTGTTSSPIIIGFNSISSNFCA